MFSFLKGTDSARLEKQRELWLRIRAKGRQRFILLRGVLGFGGSMFIWTNAMGMIFDRESIDWFLPVSLMIWLGAGYFFGRSQWNRAESRYGPNSAHS
jgi:hypothetical protein